LRQTKAGESRTIPMAPTVKEIIWRRGLWQESTKERRLFAAPADPRRNFQRALRRAKLEHATLHDLRATAATDLYLSGGDPATTMKIGGWKDPRTPLRIYARVDLERAREAVNRLPGMGHQAPDEAEIVPRQDGIVTQL
ncbi:MAG: tyrosine-type recombinase/integrase, partial [candidate division NC10 bacterium]|nr:tyrosine-type recombinase/integrase [candidate division NC10 bacterium]